MQTISAGLHSWERKVRPLFLSSPPTPPPFHSLFFPFQPWLFQTSSLPHEDMVKDHLSANNLPVSFPQLPLKGKPGAVGKSPKHLGTLSYSTRQERRGKCRTGEDVVTQLLLWSHWDKAASSAQTWVLLSLVKQDGDDVLCAFPGMEGLLGTMPVATIFLPLTYPFGKLHNNYCQSLQGPDCSKTCS